MVCNPIPASLAGSHYSRCLCPPYSVPVNPSRTLAGRQKAGGNPREQSYVVGSRLFSFIAESVPVFPVSFSVSKNKTCPFSSNRGRHGPYPGVTAEECPGFSPGNRSYTLLLHLRETRNRGVYFQSWT